MPWAKSEFSAKRLWDSDIRWGSNPASRSTKDAKLEILMHVGHCRRFSVDRVIDALNCWDRVRRD